MYLWVVIAIFVAALAALSSPLRPDAKQLYLNTQAEAEVTQIYTLHRAARKYYSFHEKFEGEVNYDRLASGYLPFGFDRGNFSSELYCLTEDGTNIPNNCQTTNPPDEEHENEWVSSDGTCCNQTDVASYLITYGPISRKWQDNRTGLPRAEILDSMKDRLGYVDGLGYSVDNAADDPYMGENNEYQDLQSDKGIVSQGSKPYYSIPQYIINNNADFAGNGQCAGDGNYCLVYITKIQ